MNKLLLFVTLFIISVTTQGQENFDYGTFKGSTYNNAFFNLSVTLPEDWVIQTKEYSKKLQELGKDRIAGNDEAMKKALERSIEQSGVLLTVFKYEVGSPVDYNPSFLLLAENIKMFPGVKKGSDYLFNVRKLLKRSPSAANYLFKEEFDQTTVGGYPFYIMHIDAKSSLAEYSQDYYSTIKGNYAISFVITYSGTDQEKELDDIIKTFIIK